MRSTTDWAKIATEWFETSEGFMDMDEFIKETVIEFEKELRAHLKNPMKSGENLVYGEDSSTFSDKKGWK